MGYWTLSTAILGRGAVAWWVERQAQRATSRPAAAHQLRIVTRQPSGTPIGAGVDADVPGLRAASGKNTKKNGARRLATKTRKHEIRQAVHGPSPTGCESDSSEDNSPKARR